MLVYLMVIDSQEDQSKFEKVYLTYRGLMYHVAYKILNNKHDAEDVVHSAFIKVAENIQKIGDPVCPKTQNYVVTIVENKAIDLYRANKRKNSSLYLDEISGIDIEATQVHGLAACMAKLTPQYLPLQDMAEISLILLRNLTSIFLLVCKIILFFQYLILNHSDEIQRAKTI